MVLENKRRQMRVRVMLAVEIYDILNDRYFVGKIVDISASGVALVTPEELVIQTPVSLTFTFEDAIYKNVPADIVREEKKQKEKYLGSAFFDLEPQARERLENTIKKVHLDNLNGLRKETIYNIYR